MQVSYIPDQEDYVAAMTAHSWRRYSASRRRWQLRLEPIIGVLFIGCGIAAVIFGWGLWFGLLEMLVGLYSLFRAPVIAPALYGRAYRRALAQPYKSWSWDVTPDKIHGEAPGAVTMDIDWSMVKGCLEDDLIILLYTAPTVFLYFPKRHLSEGQQQELMSILHAHNVPRGQPR